MLKPYGVQNKPARPILMRHDFKASTPSGSTRHQEPLRSPIKALYGGEALASSPAMDLHWSVGFTYFIHERG
jgi:hypothetical protein